MAPDPEGGTMTETPTAPRLSKADRCDRCGARAMVLFGLPGGGQLQFCAHHSAALGPGLRKAGAAVLAESAALSDSPAEVPAG